jgi:response regulator of citrate/malate metabolism
MENHPPAILHWLITNMQFGVLNSMAFDHLLKPIVKNDLRNSLIKFKKSQYQSKREFLSIK